MATVSDAQLKRIARQVNWYLSDKNLKKDKFFQDFMKDGQITVPVSTLLKCPKLAQLTSDAGVVVKALGHSSFVALSSDNTAVSRVANPDLTRTMDDATDTLVVRVSGLPASTTWKDVSTTLDALCNVVSTVVNKPRLAEPGKRDRPAAGAGAPATDSKADADTAAPGAKRMRTKEDSDAGDAAKPAEEGAKEGAGAGAGAGVGVGAGAGADADAAADDTVAANVIANCPGEKPEDVVAELAAAGIKVNGVDVTVALLSDADAAKFWKKRKQFLEKKNKGKSAGAGNGKRGAKAAPEKKGIKVPDDFKLTLGGKVFTGYTGVFELCRGVIASAEAAKPLEGDTAHQVKDLLCYHREAASKLKDAVALTVGGSESHKDTVCFKVVRKDGSVEDWSWRKALQTAVNNEGKPVVDPVTVTFLGAAPAPAAGDKK